MDAGLFLTKKCRRWIMSVLFEIIYRMRGPKVEQLFKCYASDFI